MCQGVLCASFSRILKLHRAALCSFVAEELYRLAGAAGASELFFHLCLVVEFVHY